MRRLGRFQALSGLMVGLALLLVPVGTVETRAQPDTRLQVVTSEAIFVDMIQHVGGDLVDAFNLVPPGADVEIYRPTPLDLLRASRARVAIWNGLSVDELIARDVSTLNIPDLLTVTLTEGLPVISSGDADEEEGGNPHMWLDPTLAMRYVDQIRDVLTAADPANAATYQANARRYSAEIADLDVWHGPRAGAIGSGVGRAGQQAQVAADPDGLHRAAVRRPHPRAGRARRGRAGQAVVQRHARRPGEQLPGADALQRQLARRRPAVEMAAAHAGETNTKR